MTGLGPWVFLAVLNLAAPHGVIGAGFRGNSNALILPGSLSQTPERSGALAAGSVRPARDCAPLCARTHGDKTAIAVRARAKNLDRFPTANSFRNFPTEHRKRCSQPNKRTPSFLAARRLPKFHFSVGVNGPGTQRIRQHLPTGRQPVLLDQVLPQWPGYSRKPKSELKSVAQALLDTRRKEIQQRANPAVSKKLTYPNLRQGLIDFYENQNRRYSSGGD